MHDFWKVDIDAPADEQEAHMTGGDPRDEENTKGDITGCGITEVFEAFCQLQRAR